MLNLGEAMLYSTRFDDPKLSDEQRDAMLKPVLEAVPPAEMEKLFAEALRLASYGRAPAGTAQAPPATHVHWVLLQNLAQALNYEAQVTFNGDPKLLGRAERLARRSADELENLGLYLDALNAMVQEAKALELGGQFVEAALVYLRGVELCEGAAI